MKKTHVLYILGLILLSVISVYAFNNFFGKQKSEGIPFYLRKAPDIKLLTMNGSIVSTRDTLNKKLPVLLCFFKPDSKASKHLAKNLKRLIDSLPDLHLYLIGVGKKEIVKSFAEQYDLLNVPKIIVTQDYQYITNTIFSFEQHYPYIMVYDENNRLMGFLNDSIYAWKIGKLLKPMIASNLNKQLTNHAK